MRVFFYCVGLCFGLAVFSMYAPNTRVGALEQWSSGPVELISKEAVDNTALSAPFCSGSLQRIKLGREHKSLSCVYGERSKLRVARFLTNQGTFSYAASPPYSTEYYDLKGLCVGIEGCIYSAASDAFIIRPRIDTSWRGASVIAGFSTKISLHYDTVWARYYYELTSSEVPKPIRRGIDSATVASITAAKNGPWVVFEFPAYGFGIYNTDTHLLRRIEPWSGEYNLANDPSYELAVSDDGSKVAVVGRGSGVTLYEIDSRCGDLYQEPNRSFAPGVERCKVAQIDYNQMFPGFQSAHRPIFSDSGRRLTLIVVTSKGLFRAVIAPQGSRHYALHSYVALGDSFTSGEGEDDTGQYQEMTNTQIHSCHVSRRSYPYLLGKAWELTDSKNVACSGARIHDVQETVGYNGQEDRLLKVSQSTRTALERDALSKYYPGIVEQMRYASRTQPELVTVGIGGNDIGFVDKLKSCLGYGDCDWATKEEARAETAKQIDAIQERVQGVLQELKAMSPSSRVLVIGYPKIINAQDNANCGALTGMLLSPSERTFIDRSLWRLNSVLKNAALAEGVMFVDVSDAFIGERICEGDERAMNGIKSGINISPFAQLPFLKIINSGSFHPTPEGHARTSKKIVASGAVSTVRMAKLINEYDDNDGYWGDTLHASRLIQANLVKVPVSENDMGIEVHIPSGVFKRNQELRVTIGNTDTAYLYGDGVEKVTVPLDKQITEGYYTVSVRGLDEADERVRIYEIVPIDRPDGVAIRSAIQEKEARGRPDSLRRSHELSQKAAPDSDKKDESMNIPLALSLGNAQAHPRTILSPEDELLPLLNTALLSILGLVTLYAACLMNIMKSSRTPV